MTSRATVVTVYFPPAEFWLCERNLYLAEPYSRFLLHDTTTILNDKWLWQILILMNVVYLGKKYTWKVLFKTLGHTSLPESVLDKQVKFLSVTTDFWKENKEKDLQTDLLAIRFL